MKAAMRAREMRAVLARSLLLQSCWNLERMQNLGLSLALEPWFSRIYASRDERLQALSRHQAYFNTNPYMAPLTLGMVCALEQDASRSDGSQRQAKWRRIAALKVAAGGALAGIGDALFWGALRPACAAAAALIGLVIWRAGAGRAAPFAMAAAYAAAFNAGAQTTRWKGLGLGYAWSDDIAVRMKALPWQAWIRSVRLAGAAAAAILVVLALAWLPAVLDLRGLLGTALYLAAARLGGRAVTPARFYAACCAAGGVAAAAGWL